MILGGSEEGLEEEKAWEEVCGAGWGRHARHFRLRVRRENCSASTTKNFESTLQHREWCSVGMRRVCSLYYVKTPKIAAVRVIG